MAIDFILTLVRLENCPRSAKSGARLSEILY